MFHFFRMRSLIQIYNENNCLNQIKLSPNLCYKAVSTIKALFLSSIKKKNDTILKSMSPLSNSSSKF